MIRVLVDTNVWVSALLNPRGFPARVLNALKEDSFKLILSEPLLDELLDVLVRPRLVEKYGLVPIDVAEFAALLEEKAERVEPTGELRICRDPKDDMVIETAIQGRAGYLVSRDDDLKRDLEVVGHLEDHGIRVLSVSQFIELLKKLETKRG
jgi:putative PIN family toxin of toxin-antitoxin system